MKETTAEKFERIRNAHSLMHNPEVGGGAAVLRPSEKDTFEDLLAAEETPIQSPLPNLIYLGSKETIENRISLLSQIGKHQPVSAKSGKLVVDRSASLFEYFKTLYLLAAQPEVFSEKKEVASLGIGSEKPPKIDVFPLPLLKIEKLPSAVFSNNSSDVQNIELLWQSANMEKPQRTLMDNQSSNRQEAVIFLDYGIYRFAYWSGNLVCPPTTHSQRLKLQRTGIFAFYEHKRPDLVALLRNRRRTAVLVWLTSRETWLKDTSWLLPPMGEKCVALKILPEKLKPGINEAKVELQYLSKSGIVKIKSFSVKVEAVVNNTFPILQCKLTNVQKSSIDASDLKLMVNVRVQGTGSLNGLLLVPQIGEHLDFRIEDATQNSIFEHSFSIPTEKFSLCGKELKTILISDCYYANLRFQQKIVPFQKVYLKKSLPALFFNDMPPGSERTLHLFVRRTDGKTFDLKTSVPPSAEKYLKVFRRDSNSVSFRFDTRNLQPGTNISETIGLTDADSGLQDNIKIIANVMNA